MPEWISKYWIEWLFGIVAAVLAGLYRRMAKGIRKNREEGDALREGMRALLRRQIVADCEESMRDGYATVTRKDTILEMYKSYHALGGNGAVTEVKETMLKLPTIKPEERG